MDSTENACTEPLSGERIDDVDTQCGYTASCKPSCIQRCANPKVYLLVITLFSVVQGKFILLSVFSKTCTL